MTKAQIAIVTFAVLIMGNAALAEAFMLHTVLCRGAVAGTAVFFIYFSGFLLGRESK